MQPSEDFTERQTAFLVKLDELLPRSDTTPGKISMHAYSVVWF